MIWTQPTLAKRIYPEGEGPPPRCQCGRRVAPSDLIDLYAVPPAKRPFPAVDHACEQCVRHAHTLGTVDADELLELQGAPPEVIAATKSFADHLRAHRAAFAQSQTRQPHTTTKDSL